MLESTPFDHTKRANPNRFRFRILVTLPTLYTESQRVICDGILYNFRQPEVSGQASRERPPPPPPMTRCVRRTCDVAVLLGVRFYGKI